MKFLISLSITIALAAPVLAQTPTSVSSATEAQVKQELDEAAEAYRKGDFAAAQAHSERALLLDPQDKKAPFFWLVQCTRSTSPESQTLVKSFAGRS